MKFTIIEYGTVLFSKWGAKRKRRHTMILSSIKLMMTQSKLCKGIPGLATFYKNKPKNLCKYGNSHNYYASKINRDVKLLVTDRILSIFCNLQL